MIRKCHRYGIESSFASDREFRARHRLLLVPILYYEALSPSPSSPRTHRISTPPSISPSRVFPLRAHSLYLVARETAKSFSRTQNGLSPLKYLATFHPRPTLLFPFLPSRVFHPRARASPPSFSLFFVAATQWEREHLFRKRPGSQL